jgi:hypothetical protein
MQNWFSALAVAVLVVIGFAAGPMSVVVAFLSFWITLYLVWAYDLGFKDVWSRYGLNRVKPPFWSDENKRWFLPILSDRTKVVKAASVALVIVALSLMLPVSIVRIATLIVAAWYVSEIYRAQKQNSALDRARFN